MLDAALRTRLDSFSFASGFFALTGKPWVDAMACGLIAGKTPIRLFGYNGSPGATWEAVWSPSIVYPWATVDQTITVRSSSGNDSAAGNGVQVVRIWWLNAAGVESTIDVNLNGVNPVVTAAITARRVNRLQCLGCGISEANVGNVTAYWTDNATIFAQATSWRGRSGGIQQTVPAGYRDVLTGWNAVTTNTGSIVQVVARSSPTAAWMRIDGTRSQINGGDNYPYVCPVVLPAGTDYMMEIQGAGNFGAVLHGWREAA